MTNPLTYRFFKYSWLFILFLPSIVLASDYDFSSMQGHINTNGDIMFEARGYKIAITTVKGKTTDKKVLKRIKKDFALEDAISYTETISGMEAIVLESTKHIDSLSKGKDNKSLYLFSKSKNENQAFSFYTNNEKDKNFETDFIKAYLNNEITNPYIETWTADKIYIAGDTVKLGTACHWMWPNCVGFYNASFQWSEFQTYEEALDDRDNNIASIYTDGNRVLSDEDIYVNFMGVPTTAYRVVSAYSPNSYLFRHSTAQYYIAEEINGHYLSCILSCPVTNKNDYGLNILLSRFMELAVVPENATNPFDLPTYDNTSNISTPINYEDHINLFSLGIGTNIPLGNMSNIYGVTTNIKLGVGMPIKENMAIDLVIDINPMNKRKEFLFSVDGKTNSIKGNTLLNLNLRYRYQTKIAKRTYLSPYIGIGVAGVTTNLIDEENSTKKSKTYHDVSSFDSLLGFELRHKFIGIYGEYHFMPFTSKKVKDFGNSICNIGLFITL